MFCGSLPVLRSTDTRSRSPGWSTVAVTWSGPVAWGTRCTERSGPSAVTPTRIVPFASAVAVAGILATHPVRRFEAFKRPPAFSAGSSGAFTTAHLASGNSSGRWQFWTAAVDEWRSAPQPVTCCAWC